MRDKVGYMFGDFANDFTFILSSSFLMKFYTDVMGVSAGVVGMIMMIARFVDAFTDVTMGQIVDRSKPTKDGKFRPWLKRMCGPVAIASFLIFQSGLAGMSYGFKVAWLFVTYILWGSIFYTSVNIPYGSMASAISADPKDRAELSTWRTIGSTLAGLVIGVGTPMVAYVTVNGQTVLSGSRMTIIAGVFSVCAILCYLLCFHLVRERVDVPANNSKMDIGKMLKSVFTNRALLGIIAAALFLLLAMLMVLSLAACGDKSSATVDAEGLGKALTERVQFDSTMSAIDAGDYLELPEGSSAAAYMSDGSTMEEIFVVSCKDKTDASAVKIAMQELLDSQTQEAGRYQPEEAERLNNAVFATYGTCVVLCVTSDTDTANAVIKEYVG